MLTYLQHFVQHHVLLSQLLVGALVIAAATIVLMVGLRPEQDHYAAAHRGRRRAWRLRTHQPRHGERPRYTPRHESEASAGYRFDVTTDGDITVEHSTTTIADEPTNATLDALLRHREPVGAAA